MATEATVAIEIFEEMTDVMIRETTDADQEAQEEIAARVRVHPRKIVAEVEMTDGTINHPQEGAVTVATLTDAIPMSVDEAQVVAPTETTRLSPILLRVIIQRKTSTVSRRAVRLRSNAKTEEYGVLHN